MFQGGFSQKAFLVLLDWAFLVTFPCLQAKRGRKRPAMQVTPVLVAGMIMTSAIAALTQINVQAGMNLKISVLPTDAIQPMSARVKHRPPTAVPMEEKITTLALLVPITQTYAIPMWQGTINVSQVWKQMTNVQTGVNC